MSGRALACTAASVVLALTPPALAVAVDDSGGPSAQQLAQQAKQNLLAATSVHLRLTDHSAGTAANKNSPISTDLTLDRKGNCVGTLRMGGKGGSVELIKQGEQVWMKPDTAFWKAQVPGPQGDAVAQLFKDRYIHGTTKDAMLRGLSGTCDLNAFQQQVDTGPSSAGKSLTKGAETTVDGTKVIPLTGTENGKQAVLYVTSGSPHRLVEATQKGHGTDTTLAFSDYDKPVPSATPSPSQSVDVGKLQQRLQST